MVIRGGFPTGKVVARFGGPDVEKGSGIQVIPDPGASQDVELTGLTAMGVNFPLLIEKFHA